MFAEPPPIPREQWSDSLLMSNAFYNTCHNIFHGLPDDHTLKTHRFWFRPRGFGEDAFHVMWWMLFHRYRPSVFLEIGVFRGQTLTLAALLQGALGIDRAEAIGVSPMSASVDSVSRYAPLNYERDIQENIEMCRVWQANMSNVTLIRGLSQEDATLNSVRKRTERIDLLYIDGNHEEARVREDFELYSELVPIGGIVVFDDASLYTKFSSKKGMRFAGHPGPSRVADSVAERRGWNEVLRVGHNRAFYRYAA